MIRLGLSGCGAWGWRYMPAALEAGGCAVTRVHRVGAGCPEEARPYLSDVKMVERPSELAEEVDAVVVAAPPGAMRTLSILSFLSLGLPVMVEKPLALSAEDAAEIATRAEQMGVPLLVNHQHLFAPAYEVLRGLAAEWEAFDAVSYGCGKGPERSYSALWDYGPHDVSMALGLAPGAEVKSAIAFGAGTFHVALEDGRKRFFSHVSCASTLKQRSFSLLREGGETLVYDDLAVGGAKLRMRGVVIDVSAEKPLTRAVAAFVAAVREGTRGDWRFGAFGARVVARLADAERNTLEGTQP